MPVTDKHNPVKFHISYNYDVMSTCIKRSYPKDFDPWFKTRNVNSTATQRTLTEDDLIKTEIVCTDVKTIEEVKEAYPKNGIAEVTGIFTGNITKVEFKASYLDTEAYSQRVETSLSDNNRFIQAYVMSSGKSSSDGITIKVESNTEMTYLIYKIIAESSLIDSKLIRFSPTKEHTFKIKPTAAISTSADILIYYISEDGELVSDKVEAEIDNLKNHINIHLSSEQAKPSDNITITVDSNPNSYIGLLGVDQSVLLFKQADNDLTRLNLARERMNYQSYDVYNDDSYGYRAYRHYENFRLGIFAVSNAKPTPEHEYIPICYDDTKDYPLDGFDARPDYYPEAISGESYQMSFHKTQSAPGSPKPVKIRKEFPETWLFEDFDLGDNTKHVLSKKVPDTITSWIITGFSLNADYGLGITKESTKLNVFQPFFVSTNLPYSIKRGEIVSIPFAVFNYLGTDQNVVVKFFNSDREFEFVDVDVNRREKRALVKERMKEILVKSNEGSSITFMIRPLKVGQITIKVTAESQQAGDGIERQLKVEPEGVPQYFNEAVFVDLRNQKNFQKNIQISVPVDAVDDSIKIEASVIGDILGPTLENLDNLIQLPYGCAEQNMLKFVPNILVLEYLTILNKLTPEMEVKVKKHLDVGYQKQLTYKNTGGSYSGFGMKSEKGSTWLTAYVAKSFNQASKYIEIDQQVIIEALDFLTSVQAQNGSFPEYGHVSYTPMQGGASKGIGLTAYTLITFLENKQHNEKYKEVIKHALDYIVTNVKELDDIYVLAIASYALQLAGHEMKDELLVKLNVKAQEMDGMKYWKKEIVDDEGRMYRHRSILNVEITSYAMLAFIIAGHDQQLIPIMKWLVSQRNHRGGFQSTQDTVVGLQALSQLASIIPFSNNQMTITVKPEYSAQKSFDLNSKNSLILQKAELESNSRTYQVTANGTGFAILQISYKYNLDKSGIHPRFNLMPTIDSTSNKEFLNLKVCTNFVPDLQHVNDKSNMAIMEVTLPSGFTFDADHIKELMSINKVKKVETKDADTVIMVYFDDIDSNDICPSFHAYRTHAVANQKPAPIVVYDYYDNSRHARAFYNPPQISLCDICQGADDCKDACEVPTVVIV
ncbi:CD109 antigen-like [Chironomus tepperi]|uniref:CD109 antigen-like n=1 Tax=Chironomus tepperi TaxID=113505 RepID=UPI00391F6D7D